MPQKCIRTKKPGKFSNRFNDDLYYAYLKWKSDPKTYGSLLTEKLEKVVADTLQRNSWRPFYERIEDVEDLHQEILLRCFKAVTKVKVDGLLPHEANKTIYNYLQVTATLYLRDKAKKVRLARCKDLIREAQTPVTYFTENLPVHFIQDPVLMEVLDLRVQGFGYTEIQEKLNITSSKLKKYMQDLRKKVTDAY